ncbi:MAG: hypothetical protein E6Z01_09935 [Actinomyces sp.]|nr:hypothetical protein [Actinomyces sp.]
MNKQELYQIAFSIINHKKLRNFGTSGHVETVALLSKLNTEHHLDIEIGEDELSEIDFSKDAYCTNKKETWSNRERKL